MNQMKDGLGWCWLSEANFQEGLSSDPGIMAAVEKAKKNIPPARAYPSFEIQAWVGFWCGDTLEHFPGFLEALDSLGFPHAQVRLFSLDRAKSCPKNPWVEDQKKRKNVTRLPTFIVLRQGLELGRMVESPQRSILEDLTVLLGIQEPEVLNPPSLQEEYSPKSICFGCGPQNEKGLRIRSVVDENHQEVVAIWKPESQHQAFPGVLNGGIIGALLDCHSNWTAAWAIMKKNQLPLAPCTVTADYSVKLLRPTPVAGEISLTAWVKEVSGDRAVIQAQLFAGEKLCATCEGTFVAVKPGHPAYHRW